MAVTIPILMGRTDSDARYIATVDAAVQFGVSTSASASSNTTNLQAAVNAAIAQGRNLRLPFTAPGASININAAIVVNGPVKIYGYGINHTVIHQTIKPNAIFRVTGNNVTITEMGFLGDGLDMSKTGTAASPNTSNPPSAGVGDPNYYANYCGVWFDAGSDGGTVRNVKGSAIHRAVRVDPGVGTDPATVPNIQNITIDGVVSNRCWTGVTVAGADNVYITNVSGNYQIATAGSDATTVSQPPHLIYTIDRTGLNDVQAFPRTMYNVNIDGAKAFNSTDGKAFAIKGITGGTAKNLHANNTQGCVDAIALIDYNIQDVTSINDTYLGPSGANMSAWAINCTRLHMSDITVRFANMAHGYGFGIDLTCVDVTCDNVKVVANNTDAAQTGVGGLTCMSISGVNTTLNNPVATSIGASIASGIQFISAVATNLQLNNPRTRGGIRWGIYVSGMVGGLTIDYDPNMLQIDATLTTLNTKAIAIDSLVTNVKLRPRDHAMPVTDKSLIFYDYGLDLGKSGRAASRALSGQVATAQFIGTWVTDVSNTDGTIYESTATAASNLVWALASNMEIETRLQYGTEAGARVGLCVDQLNNANFVACRIGPAAVDIVTVIGGTTAVKSTVAFTPVVGRIYRLKARLTGALVSVYVDDALLTSYTLVTADATSGGTLLSTGTNHGYYASGSSTTRFFGITGRRLS